MAKINGGEMLIRAMEQLGIHEIFTLHGGHLDVIYQACLDHEFRVIDTRHEQAAAHMADGWARTTGRPGVAIVTAGPGVTDAVTGVANAYMDAIPMICIGGRSPLRDEDKLPLQNVDQIAIMRPITKYARTVLDAERIPEYFATAYRHAVSGRPGPVFLDLPIDILFTPIEEREIPTFEHVAPEGRPAANVDAVERALAILEQAERPVIFAGGGVMFADAQNELREFVERARIPVVTNSKARGCVSERTDLGYSGAGVLADPQLAVDGGGTPDVVLMLGARVGMNTGSSGGGRSVIPDDATLIQVDIEPEEIGRVRDVQLGLVGDVRETLRTFLERSGNRQFRDHTRWVDALVAARERGRHAHDEAMDRTDAPIHQAQMARTIAECLDGEAIISADGGETSGWIGQQAIVESAGRWLSHGYLGCLGVGIPFGLAAKLAHPERKVLTIIGDGSVGLNFAEFDTAVRHNLPLVVVVNNDQGWGMSRHLQIAAYGKGRTVAVELGPTRYDAAAAAFGVHAEFVERADQIRPALDRSFASGRPACINILTDPTLPIQDYGAYARMTQEAKGESDEGDEVSLPYYGRRRLTTRP